MTARNAATLEDHTLVELATHDFLTAMQMVIGELALFDLRMLPTECAALYRVTSQAFGNLDSLVKRYRAGFVDHAELGNSLPDSVEKVTLAVEAFVEQLPCQTRPEDRRTQLSNAAKYLKAAGVASANLVLGLGDWRSEPGRTLDLDSLLEEMAQMHFARARERGVELVVQLGYAGAAPCVPGWVVTTVVGNFLTNAIKYTDQGRVALSSAPHGDSGVEVSVTDTGIGMDAETLSKLTEPWARARQVVAEGREGQGLGLAMADWAARAVGAQLTFSSEVGFGTRASLLIPASA